MILLPAIDLKDGNCVRLLKGDFNTAHQVAESAVETALAFKSAGAKYLHLVDLDGAKSGGTPNRELILKTVTSFGSGVEVGGGIRSMETVEDYLKNGVYRVILGSAALSDPAFLREAVFRYGDRIAVGIDARNGRVSTHGWTETSGISYLEFAKQMESIGVKAIIFTDINCDGTLEGPNFEQLKSLSETVNCKVIASGGIRDIGHIEKLRQMGIYGAICGESIYSGTLDLAAAIRAGGEQNAG